MGKPAGEVKVEPQISFKVKTPLFAFLLTWLRTMLLCSVPSRCSPLTQRRSREKGECASSGNYRFHLHQVIQILYKGCKSTQEQIPASERGSACRHKCKPSVFWCVFRSVLVKRMFRASDEDLCPSPHKQIKEDTHKRGTRWQLPSSTCHYFLFYLLQWASRNEPVQRELYSALRNT